LGAAFLPFVFVAKHDTQDPVKELYERTWNENVGGARTALLYLQEIVSLAIEHLDSARWAVKHAAALSIADAAKSGAQDLNLRQQEQLWPALDQALVGKSWEGKEDVLEAYVTFAQHSVLLQQSHPEVTERIRKASLYQALCETLDGTRKRQSVADTQFQQIFLEAKRKNAAYRCSALASLGKFAHGYDRADLSSGVLDIITTAVDDVLEDEDEMEIDGGGKDRSSTIRARYVTPPQQEVPQHEGPPSHI
jgi:proteasome component ECM29